MKVKSFLNDFQESIDRLEERTKPDYAGSAEAGTLLRQATAIERFFRQQPAGTRGESEWNRLATDLKTLAAAYGTEFPLADGAVVRRIGDRELEETIDKIVRSGEELERALNSDFRTDTSTDKAARDAVVGGANQLVKDAKELKDRVDDAEPSSGEAERVLAGAARIKAFIESHKVPASSTAWTSAGDSLRNLASAYGRTWPPK